jgi:serine/threonine protein phosphatase PrpC/ribosomal protein L40E
MLLCPQCQFENPNTNKFCQRCGTSLSHKTCEECGNQVPVNAATCDNCGAFTGTVWWAIISKEPDSLAPSTGSPEAPLEGSDLVASNTAQAEVPQIQVPIATDKSEPPQPETAPGTTLVPSSAASPPSIEEDEDQLNTDALQVSAQIPIEESSDEGVTQPLLGSTRSNFLESTSEGNTKDEASSPTSLVIYLDHQQRYRLLEPQSLQKQASGEETSYGVAVRVLDSQPFQKSPLEALMDQKQGNSNKFELSMTQEARHRAPLAMPSDTWKVLGIPAIAHPYLALHEAYYPTLPEVHDAWQQDGEAVLLLEDRSGWQLLCDLWGSEQLSPLQILYWLDEMAKLWEALEPWHYCQSLLEITNLRVDEDQALGLQRLYPDAREQQPTLRDLGEMWQMLFNQSQRTQFTSLGGVFRQMCTTEIGTIQELRTQLEAIAHEQQASSTTAALYPDSPVFPRDSETQGTIAEDKGAAFPSRPPLPEITPGSEGDDLPTVILPMQLMSLDDAGCTDIGHQREHNEDCFGIYTQIKKQETSLGRMVQARGLYILCDGMGGHAAGEVASAMAVERIKRYFQENSQDQLPTEESVREAVRLANLAIYDVNQQNARSGSGRMGTTLVMMLVQNTKVVIAHVGDSRLYRLTRKRGLEQLTVDHEVGERERQRGVDPEIAYSRPDAYQLTQALGPRSEQFVNPDVQFLELNEDTLFVLCSDGLSDNDLIETHWQTHLAPLLSSRANLEQGILQLIELANEHNGHDNITALLIRVKVRPNFEHQQLL